MQPIAPQPRAPLGSYIPRNDTATYQWFRKLLDETEQREEDGFCSYTTDHHVTPHFARAVEEQGLVEGRKSSWRGNRCYRITALGQAAFDDYVASLQMDSRAADAHLKNGALERQLGEAA